MNDWGWMNGWGRGCCPLPGGDGLFWYWDSLVSVGFGAALAWRSMPQDGRVVSVGLRRHYTLLDVNRGWPRFGVSRWMGFLGGFLAGLGFWGFLVWVAFAGVFCLGCHWLPLGLNF